MQLFDWLHKAWSWLITLLSGAGAVQVTVPQPKPEPVQEQSQTFEHVIYYIFREGPEPQWEKTLERSQVAFPVAKLGYNSDGTCHLTIVDGNEEHTEYIIATASIHIDEAIKNNFLTIGEIEYVDDIYF